MAGIDKMWIHSYDEFSDLRRWAIAYYPKLFVFIYHPLMRYEDYDEYRASWVEQMKTVIKREYNKLGIFSSEDEAIDNLIKYYKESVNYDCPFKQAKEEVNHIIAQHEKAEKGDLAIAEDFEFVAMRTPLNVDKKLKWICPIPCVRKYLHEQCGVNPKYEWFYKIFWRGKKYFL